MIKAYSEFFRAFGYPKALFFVKKQEMQKSLSPKGETLFVLYRKIIR